MSWLSDLVFWIFLPLSTLVFVGVVPFVISFILVKRFLVKLGLFKGVNLAIFIVLVSLVLGFFSAGPKAALAALFLSSLFSYAVMILYSWVAIPVYSLEEKKLTLSSEKYYSNYLILVPASTVTAGTFITFLGLISR